MKESEELFIETIKELTERKEKAKQYDLIKASGILRQILIDSPSILDKVNETYKIKFVFKTILKKKLESNKIIQNGIVWEPVIAVSFIEPRGEMLTSELKKDMFLSYEVFNFEGHTFTIKDIIKISANVLGGVHFDKPKTQRDNLLTIANKMINYPDKISACAFAIKEISNITINAVQPLIDEINKNGA